MNLWRTILFCFLALSLQQTYGQGQWAWMHGPSQFCVDSGIYGTMGVPNPANYPSPRAYPCNWVDNKGNFWIYSGSPVNYGCGSCNFIDMWRFNPNTLEWTWIGGPDTALYVLPKYDTAQGHFSNLNSPGMRIESTTWTDDDGNLWLAGGIVGGQSTYFGSPDVWKYDISINQWAWMGGPKVSSSYSVHCNAIAKPVSNAGGFYGVTSCWRDSNDVYIFSGMNKSTQGALPELIDQFAIYNMVSNRWRCLAVNDPKPDVRMTYAAWKDSTGLMWLFGGHGGANGLTDFKDIWYFDKNNKNWTLVRDAPYSYPVLCMEDTANYPNGRFLGTNFTDSCGRFWVYGGAFFNNKLYNDLWMLNPYSGNWQLMSGNKYLDTTGSYGTYQIPAMSNLPPSRYGAAGFLNSNGIWLFSGASAGVCSGNIRSSLADLWLYKPEPISASFTFTDSAVGYYTFTGSAIVSCSNDASKYLWDFDDPASGAANTAQGKNVNHHFAADGQHNITMYAMDCFGHYDTVMHTISFRDTAGTGVNNEADSAPRISLFPNPAGKELNVSLTNLSGNNYLRIVNSLGQTVLSQQNLHEGTQVINIAPLNAGLYCLELQDEEMRWRIKKSFLKY